MSFRASSELLVVSVFLLKLPASTRIRDLTDAQKIPRTLFYFTHRVHLCTISLPGLIKALWSDMKWETNPLKEHTEHSLVLSFHCAAPWLNREAEISSNNLPTCFSQSWWFRHQECSGIAAGLLQQGVLMLTGLRGTETLKERSTEVMMGCKLTHQCLGRDAAVS